MRFEASQFSEVMDDVGTLYGKTVTPDQKRIWYRILADKFSLEELIGGIQAHAEDPDAGKFFPLPAHIIGQIRLAREQDGRPEADEAWSLCLLAFDEDATVCVNDEIMQAKTAADPVMAEGDKVGARMAFRAAYERIVAEARSEGRGMRWWMSLGHDVERREPALLAAVETKRITASYAKPMLPPPPAEGPVAAIAGLLTGSTMAMKKSPGDVTRRHLADLKAALEG